MLITLTRKQMQSSPADDEAAAVDMAYGPRLHDAHGREGCLI